MKRETHFEIDFISVETETEPETYAVYVNIVKKISDNKFMNLAYKLWPFGFHPREVTRGDINHCLKFIALIVDPEKRIPLEDLKGDLSI